MRSVGSRGGAVRDTRTRIRKQTKQTKRTLAHSRNARYNQRLSRAQLELANATRLFNRQLAIARQGAELTLHPRGQRATKVPRRWAVVASLFGGQDCHPMYTMGALAIAKKLPVPWALWLAVDDSTVEAWSA